jgi:predicted kinase
VIVLPQLILVVGVAGSGKTEIGKLLAKKLNYVYLDKDTLTRRFTEALLTEGKNSLGNPNDRESEYFINFIRPIEYKITMDVAEENLRLGNHVVVSAPFLAEAANQNWIRQELYVTRRLLNKIAVKVVWVRSDRKTERVRLINRNAARDEWKLRNWDQYCDSIKDFAVTWDLPENALFVFDNTSNPKISFPDQMEMLLKWIKS